MRISGEQVLLVSQLVPTQVEREANVASRSTFASSSGFAAASISPTVGSQMKSPSHFEIQRVAEIVDTLPDVREDVVASLRSRIEAGTYSVSGEEIAEMMVRRYFADLVR